MLATFGSGGPDSLIDHWRGDCHKEVATDSMTLGARGREASRARAPATRVCLADVGRTHGREQADQKEERTTRFWENNRAWRLQW